MEQIIVRSSNIAHPANQKCTHTHHSDLVYYANTKKNKKNALFQSLLHDHWRFQMKEHGKVEVITLMSLV